MPGRLSYTSVARCPFSVEQNVIIPKGSHYVPLADDPYEGLTVDSTYEVVIAEVYRGVYAYVDNEGKPTDKRTGLYYTDRYGNAMFYEPAISFEDEDGVFRWVRVTEELIKYNEGKPQIL